MIHASLGGGGAGGPAAHLGGTSKELLGSKWGY